MVISAKMVISGTRAVITVTSINNFAQTAPAAPLVERRRYLDAVPRPMPAAPRRYLTVVPRQIAAAPRRCYLIVAPSPMTSAPLVVRCRY
jgi:hypothetical protein